MLSLLAKSLWMNKKKWLLRRDVHANSLSFLRQKAKVAWLTHGDDNTKVFHQSLRLRRVQARIYGITNMQGTGVNDSTGVANAFLDFYQQLLGSQATGRRKVDGRIVAMGPVLNQKERLELKFTKLGGSSFQFQMIRPQDQMVMGVCFLGYSRL